MVFTFPTLPYLTLQRWDLIWNKSRVFLSAHKRHPLYFYIFISSAHAFALLRYVIHDDHKKTLLSTQNQRNAFIEVFLRVLAKDDNTNSILSMKYKSGHSQEKSICCIAFTAFNICCKNIVSEIREEAHAMKKRPGSGKNSKPERKIKKLQSN